MKGSVRLTGPGGGRPPWKEHPGSGLNQAGGEPRVPPHGQVPFWRSGWGSQLKLGGDFSGAFECHSVTV